MGNTTPSRSFNTVKHSNRDKRIKRRRKERIVVLSMFLVVMALVLSLAVFAICSIVDAIKANRPDTPSNDPPAPSQKQSIVYEKIPFSNTAVKSGELLIVNEWNAYDFTVNKDIDLQVISKNRVMYDGVTNTYTVQNTGWKLHTSALSALNEMMYKHYELFTDNSVVISSAHRTAAEQEASSSSTAVGHSDHHTGLCVALREGSNELSTNHWIYQNCHKYGFIQRYPTDKKEITGVSVNYEYCFRYVGVAHATYIAQKGLCLEEYVTLLQNSYSGGEHLQITTEDGKEYEVYYVAVSQDDLTTIEVPKNYAYTISGDNMRGFIVTVDLNTPK